MPVHQIELLEHYFSLEQVTPTEALAWSPEERQHALGQALAVLIHWDEHSLEVLAALKAQAQRHHIPLLALCPPREAELVAALIVGADDALAYPVRPVLLQAKLMARRRGAGARRRSALLPDGEPPSVLAGSDGMAGSEPPEAVLHSDETRDVCVAGSLTLDFTARRFFVCDEAVELTPKEFDLMAYMMQRVGNCLTRDQLLDEVWGLDFDPETSVLGTQIYTIRRKLALYDLAGLIETVRGIGYRFVDETRLEMP